MTRRDLQPHLTRGLQFALDVSTLVLAFVLAYLLRFEFALPDVELRNALQQLPYVVLIQLGALALAGVYSFIWRYVGLGEVKAFVYAAIWSGLVLTVLRLSLPDRFGSWRVPLSVTLMGTVLAFGGVLSLRVARRYLYEGSQRRHRVAQAGSAETVPTLLIGAGRAGLLAAREIEGRGDMNLDVKGFVDDDPEKQGAVIHGVRVLGTTEDMPRLVKDLGISQVVITIAQISRQEILHLIGLCRKIQVGVRIIPGLYDVLQGKVQVTRIRNVQIEDLLGREPIYLDEAQLGQFLAGKRVMVTGAGGSIGSELARQVARFQPAKLLLLERAEFALFEIDGELRRTRAEIEVVPLVADVCDEARMRMVMGEQKPQIIFHAAAHKHVPLLEAHPLEAVETNVLGTANVVAGAAAAGVDHMVFISSDKAVNPHNVLGRSKRIGEQITVVRMPAGSRWCAVRFGNVVGSRGSVIPTFAAQIAAGGPVTVTDPRMTRYFMSIHEAVQLVLQAAVLAAGGEVFMLDMGDPVNILDLAERMIRLSGRVVGTDVPIRIVGRRPGEKLHEDLRAPDERSTPTAHPSILRVLGPAFDPGRLKRGIDDLERLVALGAEDDATQLLGDLANRQAVLDDGTMSAVSPQ